MNILFTICGRAGSKGFRNKNLKEMKGVPLIYYSLAAIKGFMDGNPEHNVMIALNTDSDELQAIVSKQTMLPGVLYAERKQRLAGDFVAKVEVIKDTYLTVKEQHEIDAVVDADITSPMRTIKDIENILDVYKKRPQCDLVFSVVKSRRSPYFNMVEEKTDGNFQKVCKSDFTARQQAPACYELNASIYVYRPSFLEKEVNKTILDYNCGISLMKDYLILDIDSEEDFKMMSALHGFYCENDEEIKRVYEIAKGFME